MHTYNHAREISLKHGRTNPVGRMWKSTVAMGLLCAISACASGPIGSDPSIELTSLSALPPPAAGDYVIPPGHRRFDHSIILRSKCSAYPN